jgi:cytochrome c5
MERKITMNFKHLLGIAVATAAFVLPLSAPLQAQTGSATKPVAASFHQPATKTATAQVHGEGERIFVQNCSRCHTAPESFSPSIAGTVVRHMRVRASLSQHEEQELLRYFNP